ncbi:MAG: class I SAM-dependent methyltransferase [Planctomycetota bacterium]
MPLAGDLEAKLAHSLAEVQMYRNMAAELGLELMPGANVLDFGCGDGGTVLQFRRQGFRSYGIDIVPGFEQCMRLCRQEELAKPGEEPCRLVSLDDYWIPFEDNLFDFIWSNQVFEHVQNYAEAFREMSRVLRPGGFGIHVFPSRYTPIEPHRYVPMATIWRSRPYLKFWARLGVRNPYQRGQTADVIAESNARYLANNTNYLTKRELLEVVGLYFSQIDFIPGVFGKHCFGRKRLIYRVAAKLPFGNWLTNTLFQRVLLVRRPLVASSPAEATEEVHLCRAG